MPNLSVRAICYGRTDLNYKKASLLTRRTTNYPKCTVVDYFDHNSNFNLEYKLYQRFRVYSERKINIFYKNFKSAMIPLIFST